MSDFAYSDASADLSLKQMTWSTVSLASGVGAGDTEENEKIAAWAMPEGAAYFSSSEIMSINDPRALIIRSLRADRSLTDDEDDGSFVEGGAIDTCVRFIANLPLDLAEVKYAPDGEGGIMLLWGKKRASVLTIERDRLHFSVWPADSKEHYLHDIQYRKSTIPSEILIRLRTHHQAKSDTAGRTNP